MKKILSTLLGTTCWAMAVFALRPLVANAAILAQYHLGEAGTVSGPNNLPQDSSGNGYNFQNPFGTVTVDNANFAPGIGSTASMKFSQTGFYGTSGNPTITNNFEVDLYAYATNPGQASANLFSSADGSTGSLDIAVVNNGGTLDWAAALNNEVWIGAVSGAGQPVTLNSWTHLQVDVINNLATFYINGVAQAGTESTITNPFAGWGSMHLGVTPGGGSAFTGNIDELTISSVPEPSSIAALCGLGAMGLFIAARRRRKG
jgi:hypothetical protein